MVLRTVAGARTAEDVEDLRVWLEQLDGPGPVHETVLLGCGGHGENRPTWVYVEADASQGVARRRCLSCARSAYLLDSEQRWSFPSTWSCGGCGHSIAEVAAGLHLEGELVAWVAFGARCVECGRVDGLTDMVLPGLPRDEVLAQL